jgi:hypothetical protein
LHSTSNFSGIAIYSFRILQRSGFDCRRYQVF